MPIYEYECRACGHQLEAFQKMSEAPLTDCPKCKKSAMQRLVSAGGFQLKGTGWYATDFRNKGKSEVTNPDTKPESSGQDKTSSDSSDSSSSTDKAD